MTVAALSTIEQTASAATVSDLSGITVVTVFALLLGILSHVLKQLITARRNKAGVSLNSYVTENWPESALAMIFALVLYLALPEIAQAFPDLLKPLGIGEKQTVFSSFMVGYLANSLSDFIGGRAKTIGGS
jgi:hypothetical protein